MRDPRQFRAWHLVVRGEGERLVLDARVDACCVLTLERAAVVVVVVVVFDAVAEWL